MEKIAYGGWENCIRLHNGKMELVVTTDVGPRVIRLGFIGGPNLFKEWPEHLGQTGGDEWRIYGGHRLWHAPEVMPRTYAPDNTGIHYASDGQSLILKQPVEASTGVEKEMVIELQAQVNKATVIHRLTNRNSWTIELAPWALSVMQGPGQAIVPQESFISHSEKLLPARSMTLWGYTNMADPRWTWGRQTIHLRCDPANEAPQKLGIMNTVCWAAFAGHGAVFIKRFSYQNSAAYPDFGANTELFTKADMLEVETLGPLTRLEPGKTVEHVEHWSLHEAQVGTDDASVAKLQSLVKGL